jgi:hypothetical protein
MEDSYVIARRKAHAHQCSANNHIDLSYDNDLNAKKSFKGNRQNKMMFSMVWFKGNKHTPKIHVFSKLAVSHKTKKEERRIRHSKFA